MRKSNCLQYVQAQYIEVLPLLRKITLLTHSHDLATFIRLLRSGAGMAIVRDVDHDGGDIRGQIRQED